MVELIESFAEAADGARVGARNQRGGKAHNLIRLRRAGFPVPPGFVLLTGAYHQFLRDNDLDRHLRRLLAEDDTQSARHLHRRITSALGDARMPREVSRAVLGAYREMGGGAVAVRSSATAEDLTDASFAGQYETYLHVRGEEELLRAVRGCWASLWTERAIAYRTRRGIDGGRVALAVIVQRMICADYAGVAFSANPVNNRRDQVLIEAAPGVADDLVSGRVAPERWTVRPERDEAVRTSCAESGKVLTRRWAHRLAHLARHVEDEFGAPQDIEWAAAEGDLYLLQSRPITTLFPLPSPPPEDEGVRVYLCLNRLQGLNEPLTPMGLSVFGRIGTGFSRLFRIPELGRFRPPAFKTAAGRIYVDVTAGLAHRVGRRLLRIPAMVDRPMVQILEDLMEDESCPPPADDAPRPALLRPRLLRFIPFPARVLAALAAPDWARRRLIARMQRWIEERRREAATLKEPGERYDWLMRTCPEIPGRLFSHMLPLFAAGILPRLALERLLRSLFDDASRLQPVLRALPHNPTTRMDLELWRISRQLEARGEHPTARHPLVADFLARYGHRTAREIDVGVPRWREDPEPVLSVLRTYLTHDEAADPERHFAEKRRDAEAAARRLRQKVRRAGGRMRAWLAGFLLDRLRRLAGLRETPKFFAVQILTLVREVLQELGQDLADAGHLATADDVFHLTLADLEEALLSEGGATDRLREKVRRGREEYRREMIRSPVPRVMLSTGEAFYTPRRPASDDRTRLSGTGASPGTYTGRARVVRDPARAGLRPGEILVAPGTDPAWTPLFLTAGALVMEMGGTMSHGAVVAREYGIPAAVGVTGATDSILTGQKLRVDGESGEVQIMPAEDS